MFPEDFPMEYFQEEFAIINHDLDDITQEFCNYDPYDLVGQVHHSQSHYELEEEYEEEDDDLSDHEWDLISQWITNNQDG